MKKILLGTTALAAAGMLAFPATNAVAQDMKKPQPIQMSVGGYFTSMVAAADQDGGWEAAVDDIRPVGIISDAEIYFQGNSTLDNGLRVDVIVQLEANQAIANPASGGIFNANSDNGIDESYVKLTGGFGDFRVGNTKAAGFVLGTPTLPAGVMRHDTLDVGKIIVAPGPVACHGALGGGGSVGAGTNCPASPFFLNGITWNTGPSDAEKFVYISPSFAGFRVGGSYWPQGPGGDRTDTMPNSASNATYDLVAQYQNKFGDIGLSSTLGYVNQTNGNGGQTELHTWHGGAALSFAGFRVSGRYGISGSTNDGGLPATVHVSDDEQWDAEVLYRSGPWGVSFTYIDGSSEDSVAITADSERTVYMLGADYAIGPGIKVGANVFRADWDDETTAAVNNNDGWAVVGGINVRF